MKVISWGYVEDVLRFHHPVIVGTSSIGSCMTRIAQEQVGVVGGVAFGERVPGFGVGCCTLGFL